MSGTQRVYIAKYTELLAAFVTTFNTDLFPQKVVIWTMTVYTKIMDTCIQKHVFKMEITVGVDRIQLFELAGLRCQRIKSEKNMSEKAPEGIEPSTSCLLDRRSSH